MQRGVTALQYAPPGPWPAGGSNLKLQFLPTFASIMFSFQMPILLERRHSTGQEVTCDLFVQSRLTTLIPRFTWDNL